MKYTLELIKIASKLSRGLTLLRSECGLKYLVKIENVVYKEKHLRQNIEGVGFTIEDACYDMIRKARGHSLENYMTNIAVDVL